jgi:tryptophan halogenase
LQVIVEQLRFLCKALLDSDARIVPKMRELENRRMAELWDDIRDFLALHYRFNRRLDTPFWRHCREHVPLGRAQEFVDYYTEAGPSLLAAPLVRQSGIFGLEGYLTIMLGQRVPTRCAVELSAEDLRAWDAYRAMLRKEAANSLTMRQALEIMQG